MSLSLRAVKHWVFDLDGTLTLPLHDFPAIRRALDIPPADDILHHLATLPSAESAAKHAWLLEHERELALAAQAAPGALELVRALQAQGCQLAILTRNAHELALITLNAIGLGACFAPVNIIGREQAAPKPDPAGLLKIAAEWQVEPSALVMVGDYLFDLECARAVGAQTILVNQPENLWPALTDLHSTDCTALLQQLDQFKAQTGSRC